MKYFLLSLIVLCSVHARAYTKDEKVQRLFEIQGIVASFQASLDESRAQAKIETRQMMDQMLTQMNLSKEFQVRMSLAGDKFMKTLQTNRAAEDIVKVLVQYYSPHFTDAEIDKLIEFYSSEVGKKDAEVSPAAMRKVTEHFKESNEKLRILAVNEFVKDLQLIAKECKCQKKK